MIVYLAIYGLLFIQYTLVHSIDFSQCDKSMKCFVDKACTDDELNVKDAHELVNYKFKKSKEDLNSPGVCHRLISIKANSAFRWQFTLVDESLTPRDGIKLEWNQKDLVTCDSAKVHSEFNSSIIHVNDTSDPSIRYKNCSFTIQSSKEILPFLQREYPISGHLYLSDTTASKIHSLVLMTYYDGVVNKMKCDNSTGQSIIAPNIECPNGEECSQPVFVEESKEYMCGGNFFMRYHTGDGKWIALNDLLKFEYCTYYTVDSANNTVHLSTEARVMCSRKRCTLCNSSVPSTKWDVPCHEYTCGIQKMLVHNQVNSNNRLTCSDKANQTNPMYSYQSSLVRFEDIKCVDKVDCAAISPSTVFECPDDVKEDCLKPMNENNAHYCPSTHHLHVHSNGQDAKEGTNATCSAKTGQWMMGVDVIKDSHVYCIKNKESTTIAAAASGNEFPYWILIVVGGVIMVIAIAIAIACFLRRRKMKKDGYTELATDDPKKAASKNKPIRQNKKAGYSKLVTGDTRDPEKATAKDKPLASDQKSSSLPPEAPPPKSSSTTADAERTNLSSSNTNVTSVNDKEPTSALSINVVDGNAAKEQKKAKKTAKKPADDTRDTKKAASKEKPLTSAKKEKKKSTDDKKKKKESEDEALESTQKSIATSGASTPIPIVGDRATSRKNVPASPARSTAASSHRRTTERQNQPASTANVPTKEPPFRIPAKDITFLGPLKVRKRFHGDWEHDYENDNSPQKEYKGEIVFAPELNEAVAIGKGIEELEGSKTDPNGSISTDSKGFYLNNLDLNELGIKVADESVFISPAEKGKNGVKKDMKKKEEEKSKTEKDGKKEEKGKEKDKGEAEKKEKDKDKKESKE